MLERLHLAIVLAGLFAAPSVLASDLDVPNEFVPGEAARAGEVNANFQAAETAVNDNDARINGLEGTVSDHASRLSTLESAPATVTRSIQLPAYAFAIYDGADIIADDQYGLRWDRGLGSTLQAALPAPPDYAGGDLTLRVLFETEGATAAGGVVEFFSRARSYFDGESSTSGVSGLSDGGVTVGTEGYLVYAQTITVPAARMQGDYWFIRLSRSGTGSTYDAPVVFHGAALEYPASR